MKRPLAALAIAIMMVFATASCTTTKSGDTQKSPLTHGNVQLTLKKGVTTKAEVLETFGAPNIATTDSSGKEVWSYQKHATVAESSEVGAYGTVILLGVGGSKSGFEQSTRTMTLIIKFDASDKVYEFRSMSSSF